MKFRKTLSAILGLSMVFGSVVFTSAAAEAENAAADISIAADSDIAEGINVKFHTRDEIRAYIASHPFDMARKAEYSSAPATWYPYKTGSISDTDRQQGLNALNSMRYIAGVGVADVILCRYGNDYAQAASLVNCINGALSHNPNMPPKIDSYTWAYAKMGAQNSNIASGFNNVAHSVVLGYLYDTNEKNISALGHRRWCLNPSMDVTGFGQVNGYSAMYATAEGHTDADNYGVCWPAQNMPVEYFPSDTAWSISMGRYLNKSDVKVTLTRKSDGERWTFSAESSDGYFNVNNDYAQAGCIIFRPDGIEKYSHGDVYTVNIEGLGSPVKYNVNFFALDGDDSVFEITGEPEFSEPTTSDESENSDETSEQASSDKSENSDETSEPASSDESENSDETSEPTSSDKSGNSDETSEPSSSDKSENSDETSEPASSDESDKSDITPSPKKYSDSKSGIEVTAQPGTFPDGTVFNVTSDESLSSDTRCTFDLSFVCGGKTVQPDKDVSVSMSIPARFRNYRTLYVFHVEGGCCNFVKSMIENGCIRFNARGFSPYIISTEDLSDKTVEEIKNSEDLAESSEVKDSVSDNSERSSSQPDGQTAANPSTGVMSAIPAMLLITLSATAVVIRKKK